MDEANGPNGIVWYTVPVAVEIRDGEVWSVRVMDEAFTLDPAEDPASPLVKIAQEAGPAWEFG